MRFKAFLGYMLFLTIRIRQMRQKWDLLKVKRTNLKCMGIMHGNLCHPYVLSDMECKGNYKQDKK